MEGSEPPPGSRHPPREARLKYVILIHGNPASRAVWEQLSQSERQSGLEAYQALNRTLAASGELLAAEALDDPGTGHRLPATTPGFVTDGPYAEAKEFIAGFPGDGPHSPAHRGADQVPRRPRPGEVRRTGQGALL